MEKSNINPEITQNFVKFIKEKSEAGIYHADVRVGDKSIPIDIFPTVFPPRSDYSVSSKSVYETFGNLEGLEVADIGCGSGIESIVAVMAGAKHVDAVDVNPEAVRCAKHNVIANNLQGLIDVFYSDLFSNFQKKKYDLIIANLPIVDFGARNNQINNALYDKNFVLHRRLFSQAKDFLRTKGLITFTHANLQSAKTKKPNHDFFVMENLIGEFGYEIIEKTLREDLGYRWINYKIKPKE